MYKLLNKMGPKSLTNLFSYKSEKQIITFGTFLVVFAYQNHAQIIWRIVSCTTEHSFGAQFQKKLGKANHFLPFEIKSLLISVRKNYYL